jgi:hypothetical protein
MVSFHDIMTRYILGRKDVMSSPLLLPFFQYAYSYLLDPNRYKVDERTMEGMSDNDKAIVSYLVLSMEDREGRWGLYYDPANGGELVCKSLNGGGIVERRDVGVDLRPVYGIRDIMYLDPLTLDMVVGMISSIVGDRRKVEKVIPYMKNPTMRLYGLMVVVVDRYKYMKVGELVMRYARYRAYREILETVVNPACVEVITSNPRHGARMSGDIDIVTMK